MTVIGPKQPGATGDSQPVSAATSGQLGPRKLTPQQCQAASFVSKALSQIQIEAGQIATPKQEKMLTEVVRKYMTLTHEQQEEVLGMQVDRNLVRMVLEQAKEPPPATKAQPQTPISISQNEAQRAKKEAAKMATPGSRKLAIGIDPFNAPPKTSAMIIANYLNSPRSDSKSFDTIAQALLEGSSDLYKKLPLFEKLFIYEAMSEHMTELGKSALSNPNQDKLLAEYKNTLLKGFNEAPLSRKAKFVAYLELNKSDQQGGALYRELLEREQLQNALKIVPVAINVPKQAATVQDALRNHPGFQKPELWKIDLSDPSFSRFSPNQLIEGLSSLFKTATVSQKHQLLSVLNEWALANQSAATTVLPKINALLALAIPTPSKPITPQTTAAKMTKPVPSLASKKPMPPIPTTTTAKISKQQTKPEAAAAALPPTHQQKLQEMKAFALNIGRDKAGQILKESGNEKKWLLRVSQTKSDALYAEVLVDGVPKSIDLAEDDALSREVYQRFKNNSPQLLTMENRPSTPS